MELVPLRRVKHIVGVEPECIISSRPCQSCVASCGEVINPDEVEHLCPKRSGNFHSPVDAAGIHDNYLVKDPTY